MHTDDLHRPLYCADILINALIQDPARPLLQLMDVPRSPSARCRDAISQFAQALRSLSVTAGHVSACSLPTGRRYCIQVMPEILAAIYVPVHPLAGFAITYICSRCPGRYSRL